MKSQLWNDLISFSFLTFLLFPSEPSLPTRHNIFFQFEDSHGEPLSKGHMISRDKFTLSKPTFLSTPSD